MTVQQRVDTEFVEFVGLLAGELEAAYVRLQRHDRRWRARWGDVEMMLNPNGPLLNGGSHGDNGQTGRKLVMDYYGPRVPIGGGVLCGKDFAHIDRAAAMAAREAAVEVVKGGERECRVTLAYAPNVDEPVEVGVEAIDSMRLSSLERSRFSQREVSARCTQRGIERWENPDCCSGIFGPQVGKVAQRL